MRFDRSGPVAMQWLIRPGRRVAGCSKMDNLSSSQRVYFWPAAIFNVADCPGPIRVFTRSRFEAEERTASGGPYSGFARAQPNLAEEGLIVKSRPRGTYHSPRDEGGAHVCGCYNRIKHGDRNGDGADVGTRRASGFRDN